MADAKLTELTATSTLTDDDLLYVVDDPGGTPASRKITVADLKDNLASAVDIPSNCDILAGRGVGATGTWPVSNRCIYSRIVQGRGPISKVVVEILTSSGNIGVSVFSNTGAASAAAPSSRRATSGDVAMPASGRAEISLGGSVAVEPGDDWYAVSVDNTTAEFARLVPATALTPGLVAFEASAHPPPASAGTLSASSQTPIVAGDA